MANPYQSIYAKDLIPIIEHVALELMSEPIAGGKKVDGTILTLAEISNQNSLYAMYNSGIRHMAKTLIETLEEEMTDDSD